MIQEKDTGAAVQALKRMLQEQNQQACFLKTLEQQIWQERSEHLDAQKKAPQNPSFAAAPKRRMMQPVARNAHGTVPKPDTGDIWSKVTNPNYSFHVHEDIYDRFIFPWDVIEAGSKVVMYGGGIVGKIFLQQLQRASYCTVVAICDRDPGATGIVEAPLITIKQLAGLAPTAYDKILIAIEKKQIAKEIRQDLELAGLPAGKIVWVDPVREDYV